MAVLQINLRPTTSALQQFGWIALAGFGVLGGVMYGKHGLFGLDFGAATAPVCWVLWGVGMLAAVFSLVAPAANRPLYVGLIVATYPIGYVLSHVLMAAFFYGMLTPVGLLFRLIGRDPLHRKFEPDAPTYWIPHRPSDTMKRYFRQF